MGNLRDFCNFQRVVGVCDILVVPGDGGTAFPTFSAFYFTRGELKLNLALESDD